MCCRRKVLSTSWWATGVSDPSPSPRPAKSTVVSMLSQDGYSQAVSMD